MSNIVRVPRGDSLKNTAILLLAAAEETDGFQAEDVVVSSYGGFMVPEEIAKKAGLDYEDEGEAMGHVYTEKQVTEAEKTPLEGPVGDIEPETKDEPKAEPAKKAAAKPPAKKAAAKKTAAKKTAAKKTTGGK